MMIAETKFLVEGWLPKSGEWIGWVPCARARAEEWIVLMRARHPKTEWRLVRVDTVHTVEAG